ncbi:hypothetical protein D3C86_940730 [compost metagenome]
MGDGQCVAFRRVVGIQRIEIARYQKRRAFPARRQQQAGRRLASGQGLSVHARHALPGPCRHRTLVLAPRARRVQPGGKAHFIAPGQLWIPARALQEVGGGRQRVGHAIDQVAAAIAIEINRQPQIGRRHELRLAECARPGPHQTFRCDVLVLDDFQSGEEFAPEIRLPTAKARQRGQGRQQGPAPQRAAEIAFHAPHGRDGGRVDAVARRRARQLRLPPRHARLAVRHPLVIHQARHVVPDGRLEFGLRIQQINDRHIGRQPGRMRIKGGRRHARFLRRAAQLRQAGGVGVGGLCRRHGQGQRGAAKRQGQELLSSAIRLLHA